MVAKKNRNLIRTTKSYLYHFVYETNIIEICPETTIFLKKKRQAQTKWGNPLKT